MKIRFKYLAFSITCLCFSSAVFYVHSFDMASFHLSEQAAVEHYKKHRASVPVFSRVETYPGNIGIVHHSVLSKKGSDHKDNSRSGKKIVFIHGSPGGWSAFQDYFFEHRLNHVSDIVSVDRPGFGYSTPHRAVPSLKEQARRIYTALAALDLDEHAVLVGHSLGGSVAVRLAIDYPNLVDSLLLLAPSLSPDLEKRRWFNYVAKPPPFRWLLPRDWRVSNDEIFPHKKQLGILKNDLALLTKKTLLIQGEKDSLVPAGNAYYFEKEWPHSEKLTLWMLPGAGHFLPWSHKNKVIDALEELTQKN